MVLLLWLPEFVISFCCCCCSCLLELTCFSYCFCRSCFWMLVLRLNGVVVAVCLDPTAATITAALLLSDQAFLVDFQLNANASYVFAAFAVFAAPAAAAATAPAAAAAAAAAVKLDVCFCCLCC